MQDRVRFVAPFLVAALGCGAELASMPPDGEDAAGGAAPDGGDAASSSVTTSANASVSSSAVTTSGSGGGAPPDCSAQPLCDDFEGAAVGALPDAAIWTPTYPNCSGTGTVAIDDSHAYSGAQSLRVSGTDGYCNHVFVGNPVISGITSTVYGRFYVRFAAPLYQGHVTFMAMKDSADGDKDLRMGGQNQVLMWNRESDDATLPTMSPSGVSLSASPAVDTWHCVEFSVTSSGLNTELDGEVIEGLVVDEVPTVDVDEQWMGFAPALTDFKLGWESYSGGPMELWFDDVVLSDSPIGCL